LWWRDFALAIVLAGAAAGLLSFVGVLDKGDTAVAGTIPSAGAETAPGPTRPTGGVSAFGEGDGAAGSGFSKDMVSVSAEGHGTFQAYFLADVSAAKMAKLAKQCVNSYFGEGYESVNCYGFNSQEAIDYAAPSTDYGAGMQHVCWTAFAGDAVNSGTVGSANNESYESEHCP
jgi:hypothetical protein